MEDEQPAATNPVFRASKRRKVFRKKADDGEAGDLDNNLQDPGVSALTKSNQDDDAVADEQTTQARSSHSSAIRRPRNHGINFSSSTAPASNAPERNDETSMVVAPPREPQAMGAQNERFVRPTGKAVVMDDRHMSAFVDSKLAEMRSATATPTVHTPNLPPLGSSAEPETQHTSEGIETTASPENGPATTSQNSATPHQASTSIQATSKPPKSPRRRRAPLRSSADTARDTLIDQIMHESQIPVYDQPTQAPNQPSNEGDNDAAAAAAFKADFLAAAEQRNLKRRPPAQPAAGAPLGPKLGGSRAQRERMKAAEEAGKKGGGK